ncbi:MAG TPA: methylmalonyl-CoA mutase subunit beta, partial [Saliniramus sp.]|nr:methylmalonyl-CoA mutase subunit beta [Saliniramus sp.]
MTDHPLATEIAGEFPAATRDDWMKLVDGVLKGGDFEKKLVSHTYDGIRIAPIEVKAEPAAQPVRAEASPWRVTQRVDHPHPAEANELALQDLEGGADSLTILFEGAAAARGFGLRIETLDDLDRALSNVMLDLIHVRLDAGMNGRQAAAFLVALAQKRGHALSDLQVDLGLDPIGAMAAYGQMSAPWEVVAQRSAETAAALSAMNFSGTIFLADGRPFHEAGASEAQELAGVLASGLTYLRALEDGGIGLDEARRRISFLLVADADEFLTIAKFRAMRRLWARVEAASGIDPQPIRLHAETAYRMATRRDPWVNMLRTSVATFSAGLGGADSVCVLPFTTAMGLPDAFARRVARNTQHILLQESNLWRVADPAAGAGGFEALTDALCAKAWDAFQQLEGEGGIVASLCSGAFQGRIAEVRSVRAANIAKRRDPITGVSEFPHLAEVPVTVLLETPSPAPGASPAASSDAKPVPAFADLVAAAADGARLADLTARPVGVTPVSLPALPVHRNAAPFEALRDRAEKIEVEAGARPMIFLANLGPIAEFNARASFAR